jgi:tetratricopeptide (TPR) repeat protein
LETVRQYGQEQLAAAGELATVRDRHLDWCIALGEQAEPHLQAAQQLVWLDRLETEHDNLRAALQWSMEDSGRGEAGVRLAGAIWRLWSLRGYPHEGRRWLEEALARSGSAPATLRARALAGATTLAHLQGDARAHTYGAEGLALYRQAGDTAGLARLLVAMGRIEGNLARTQALGQESLTLGRQVGDPLVCAAALNLMGNAAIGQSDLVRAHAYLEKGLALGRDAGDRMTLAGTLRDLGQVAMARGAHERAAALFDESLSLHRELAYPFGVAVAL